jgi:AcrR family transcriptional regulator
MAGTRRMGAPDAHNRTVLLDAAARVLAENGHAAVTARGVAAAAGLKYQLVHYYFRSMDDLLVELFRRQAEQGVERQRQARGSADPLQEMWPISSDTVGNAMTREFAILARDRPAIREEVNRYAARYRDNLTEIIRESGLERPAADGGLGVSAEALALLMTSAARTLSQEAELGFAHGHEETSGLVEECFARARALRAR